MECKCCGEKGEFTFIQENLWKKRYKCSNCQKNFWVEQDWLQGVKKLKSLYAILTFAIVLEKLAEGDVMGAVEHAFKFDLDREA